MSSSHAPFKAELLTKWSHRPQLLSKVYPLSYPEMDTIPDPPAAISWSIVFLRAEGISSMAFLQAVGKGLSTGPEGSVLIGAISEGVEVLIGTGPLIWVSSEQLT